MDIQNFWMFALAGLMLNLTPGNDMIYVATRSTGQGIKAGIVSALGITAGCMVHILAAVVGLSAILAESAVAFDVVKYLGAGYLVYLGIRALVSKRRGFVIKGEKEETERSEGKEDDSYRKIFWQGVITNVLNPKVALFFLAFLPQFIDVSAKDAHWQILFLGTWFNISGLLVNVLVALLFGKIGGWLSRSPRFVQWQERVTGIMLIALGVKVALTEKN
ncbi:MAG TPA: LysE family translocator [Chitinophagaceae bacterium]|nr:LysE family translocator [Chitinophagaceae bacterium]